MLSLASAQPDGLASAHALSGEGEAGLVSIIVPTHNRAELVLDALDCLAAQTYPNIQIVVVDDGSTDNTGEVLAHWAGRHPAVRLCVVRQNNRGVAAARNAGLALAEGEYLHFLDSDDLIDPSALAELVSALAANPAAPFAVMHVRNVTLTGQPVRSDQSGWARLSATNIYRNHWNTHAMVVRRTTLLRTGPFHEGLRYGEDTELNWRMVALCGTGVLVDAVLGTRRYHDAQHLSLHGGAHDNVASAIEAKEAFATWLEGSGLPPQRMRLSNLASIAGLGLRAGLKEDWPLSERAFALLGRLSPATGAVNAVLITLGSIRSRTYYLLLFACFRLMKNSRMAAILLRHGGAGA